MAAAVDVAAAGLAAAVAVAPVPVAAPDQAVVAAAVALDPVWARDLAVVTQVARLRCRGRVAVAGHRSTFRAAAGHQWADCQHRVSAPARVLEAGKSHVPVAGQLLVPAAGK